MELVWEELAPVDGVSREELNEILSSDCFGKFAILSRSESDYIQAGCDWQPTEECDAFLKAHESDPWVLEYHGATSGTPVRAAGHVTLSTVMLAFASYLAEGNEWLGQKHSSFSNARGSARLSSLANVSNDPTDGNAPFA